MTKEQALENKTRVQEETRKAWFQANCCGTAELATGSGKSKIAIDCLQQLRADPLMGTFKTLLVTPTESMRDDDWPAEFAKWNASTDDVKLICQASLGKEKLDKYDFIILDEYHNCTVNILKKIEIAKLRGAKILGLTATLPDKANWPDEIERVGYLREIVPSIYKVTTDEAVDLGLICDFEVQVLKFKLDTIHHVIPAGSKATPFMNTESSQYIYLTKQLQKAMYSKNEFLKFSAIQKRTSFLYNLPSKTRLAKACMDKMTSGTKRTLVLAGSIEQANLLCGDYVYHSESSQKYLDEFQDEKINILGAVKALDEGRNLKNLEQLLVVQVQSGERRLVQRIGRAVRVDYNNMDKKALIVILVSIAGNDGKCADEEWYKSAIRGFDTKRITETLVKAPDHT